MTQKTTAMKPGKDSIGNLLTDIQDRPGVPEGLLNLSTLPEFDPEKGSPPAVPGKGFEVGVIGLRNYKGKTPSLAIACGSNTVRYIKLDKFVALVEKMHDPQSATIMLENFSDRDDNHPGRGQVLARLNAKHSAITVVQGVTGRVIRSASDIALYDVYYLDRKDLASFYLAAKYQLSKEDTLDSMIAAYDGWRAFSIPLDPMNPYELGDFEMGGE